MCGPSGRHKTGISDEAGIFELPGPAAGAKFLIVKQSRVKYTSRRQVFSRRFIRFLIVLCFPAEKN